MRKLLFVTTAVAALVIATPMLAQDATAPAANSPATTVQPAQPGTDATAPAVRPKFIGQQSDAQWLASSIIGSTVYGPGDENLGDVNDIILAADGSPYALVVGVGGFLGIGEKNVAVSYDAIHSSTDADGNLKLVLDTTKEELDSAPAFVTLAMLKQQKELDATDPALQPAAPAMAPAPAPAQ